VWSLYLSWDTEPNRDKQIQAFGCVVTTLISCLKYSAFYTAGVYVFPESPRADISRRHEITPPVIFRIHNQVFYVIRPDICTGRCAIQLQSINTFFTREKLWQLDASANVYLNSMVGVLLDKLIVKHVVKTFPAFMQSESLLSCSQESATGPYLEPDEFNPCL
jgi:hypothetical protein